ncbi:PaaI family thioesterase [Pseudovibrio flavus]|uniref:PaaI family thioesterase n=1 Tax=Pseudovibrio flavus TaxID=2529854 RepID=UPI00211C12EE|nr:PaaI family thioesterase [Pseudovibrio flavus]
MSFASQPLMAHLGCLLGEVKPGEVEIILPQSPGVMQQHGYFHGGVISSIGDVSAGWSALSLMEEGFGVLTVEFKINFLNPGVGEKLVARGRVLKSGRTLLTVQSDIVGVQDGIERPVATGLFTMIAKEGLEL